MVDDDAISFVIEEARQQDGAFVHGRDGSSGVNAEIESLMRALRNAVENALRTIDVGRGRIDRGGEVSVPFALRCDAA